ncbi:SDR family oxidoreductase [Streptomyces ficellus]|uniref:NAD-dependent epimerase/dehydratase family protein n=1 Tax=Streptomyces ficellus TaxID=1977088 RepID=A0A6I6FH08_9ACTN|nr:SDR family oxidoreductase [Streptomyces ficellus]QGV76868.1 NAD-dependent epimerase/dehydratase family protein [Streptomyces ficellus]
MRTIALSGTTGFLGSHLLSRLLRRDLRVIALVRDAPPRAADRVARALAFASDGRRNDAVDTEQLRLVRADLDAERLGLPAAAFARLADEVDEVWHCAASTHLEADLATVCAINVEGTRRMLELAAAGRRRPRFVHISTAYVAGGRSDCTVAESDLDGSYGFMTPYEESKYRAELLVRAWAGEDGRRALVLRPSTLVTDKPLVPSGPRHPHSVLGLRLGRLAARGPDFLVRHFGMRPDRDGVFRVRLPGRPDSTTNIAPVEYAADAVMRLVRDESAPGTTTRHVTHPVDTPARVWLEALRSMVPWLEPVVVADHGDATAFESFAVALQPGGHRYGYLRRSYERTALDTAETRDGVPAPLPLDVPYLARTLDGPRSRSVPAATSA